MQGATVYVNHYARVWENFDITSGTIWVVAIQFENCDWLGDCREVFHAWQLIPGETWQDKVGRVRGDIAEGQVLIVTLLDDIVCTSSCFTILSRGFNIACQEIFFIIFYSNYMKRKLKYIII